MTLYIVCEYSIRLLSHLINSLMKRMFPKLQRLLNILKNWLVLYHIRLGSDGAGISTSHTYQFLLLHKHQNQALKWARTLIIRHNINYDLMYYLDIWNLRRTNQAQWACLESMQLPHLFAGRIFSLSLLSLKWGILKRLFTKNIENIHKQYTKLLIDG
jgi:hypothetical protein